MDMGTTPPVMHRWKGLTPTNQRAFAEQFAVVRGWFPFGLGIIDTRNDSQASVSESRDIQEGAAGRLRILGGRFMDAQALTMLAIEAKAAIGIAYPIGLGLAAAGAGLGLGSAVRGAMEAMGRQPDVIPQIQTAMIIGCAFIEALAIYALISIFLTGGLQG